VSYAETTALVLAMEAVEADSGNTDDLDAYLRDDFLPGELRSLERAAELLCDRADAARIWKESRANG